MSKRVIWLLFFIAIAGLIIRAYIISKGDSKISQDAQGLIARNRDRIIKVARSNDIDPLAVAGVIAAELTLNYNYTDAAQDGYIKSLIQLQNDEWLEHWVDNNEKLAQRALESRMKSNKWPISLVTQGYIASIGPAQITPRTSILACKAIHYASPPCTYSVKNMLTALLNEESAVAMTGVVINYELVYAESKGLYQARRDIGLQGTLYSSGADFYCNKYKDDPNAPHYNKIGHWIIDNQIALRSLLDL